METRSKYAAGVCFPLEWQTLPDDLNWLRLDEGGGGAVIEGPQCGDSSITGVPAPTPPLFCVACAGRTVADCACSTT